MPVGADLAGLSMKVLIDGNRLDCAFLMRCPISVGGFCVSSILTSGLSSGVWMLVVTVSCSSVGVPWSVSWPSSWP